jgi:dienelactone hydrolase
MVARTGNPGKLMVNQAMKIFHTTIVIGRVMMGLAIAATDPAADGPFPGVRQTVAIPGTQGATLDADLYHPGTSVSVSAAAGMCPVIVLGHGFSQSKSQHVNQGLHLASRGYIVLIPSSNAASDHSRYADDLRKCIDWIEARGQDAGSIFFGRVRADRVGASGHSAGGLSAILAASRDPRIRAVSVMDPVDNGNQGVAALPGVAAPVAVTYSEPSSCNANGSAALLLDAATSLKRGVKIVGANHTDPQDPASFLSGLFCGTANSTRQARYRRYMAGWFEYHLRGDAGYGPWVFLQPDGQVAADLLAGTVTYDQAGSSIEAWRFVNFGAAADDPAVAGDMADPDRDNTPNLGEYASASDPHDPASGWNVSGSWVQVDGTSHFAITFPRVTAATDIIYQVESADDLRDWQPGCSYSGTQWVTVTESTTEFSHTGAGLETITVRDNTAPGEGLRRFLRLRVSKP